MRLHAVVLAVLFSGCETLQNSTHQTESTELAVTSGSSTPSQVCDIQRIDDKFDTHMRYTSSSCEDSRELNSAHFEVLISKAADEVVTRVVFRIASGGGWYQLEKASFLRKDGTPVQRRLSIRNLDHSCDNFPYGCKYWDRGAFNITMEELVDMTSAAGTEFKLSGRKGEIVMQIPIAHVHEFLRFISEEMKRIIGQRSLPSNKKKAAH